MSVNYGWYFSICICITSGLKQYYPIEILSIVEQSCFFAYLSETDDVYLPKSTNDLFKTLSETSFYSDPLIHIGYINFKAFLWPSNNNLQAEKNDNLSNGDLVVFPKRKVDRTCLLTAKGTPPKVFRYKHDISLYPIIEFINKHCNTYRTSKGTLSYEGLHRNEILQNLFKVESISDVTSKQIYDTHYKENKVCFKNVNSDGILCEKSQSISDIKNSHVHEMQKCEKITMPTRDHFFHNYLKISKPVIIKDGIKMWSAVSKWTNDFLRQEYGTYDVHIKLTPGGEFEGVESSELWDNYNTFRIPDGVKEQLDFPDLVVVRPATLNMNFSELVDLIENVSNGTEKNISAYLEYSSIPDHLPELENDIDEMPFIKGVLNKEHLNIWFSDGNTLGKLHFDQYDNFLCQISGRKQVIMFEPHDNTRLYEGHIPEAFLSYNRINKTFTRKQLAQSTSMVMSPVDLSKVDFQRFPKFADTHPLNCTIEEGDVLFMPAFWWHEVQSFPNKTAKRNLAVNYWYDPFLTKEFPCPTCKLDINPNYRHLL